MLVEKAFVNYQSESFGDYAFSFRADVIVQFWNAQGRVWAAFAEDSFR
jgi:hypothetical protein